MPIYKIFSLIIIVMVTVFGIVTCPFLGYSNYDGDLTRMGMLPEKYFGWTAPQPKIDNTLLISSNWVDADILVIGDSFSEKLIWQSKLVQAGYKVRTENWASVGQICHDFNDWLNLNKFKGRYVIIQSVENSFDARLKKSVQCNKTQYKFLQKKEFMMFLTSIVLMYVKSADLLLCIMMKNIYICVMCVIIKRSFHM